MKRLLLAVLLLAGCVNQTPGTVPVTEGSSLTTFHDTVHHVTCWFYRGWADLSCLPDSQVTNP